MGYPQALSALGLQLQVLFSRSWKFRVGASKKKGNHVIRTLKAALTWIISSGKMKLRHSALPGFKCWRASMNSLCEKVSKIFTEFGVVDL